VRPSLVRQVLLLLGLAFLPAIGQAIYFRNAASWQHPPVDSGLVSLEKAKSWGGGVIWIDARPEADFERAHIPGALLLNEDDWNAQLRTFLTAWSPERKVVAYCSALSCSASHAVAERLRNEAELKNIYVLEGGWEAWEKGQ
jgi:rhodanese-related sulfurtransferase